MGTKKRNIFGEMVEGLEAMREHREGKVTLRTHEFVQKPAPQVDAAFVRDTRAALNMSQAVFANFLQINKRTLENWEQGRTMPNEQANVLIQLARHFPDTLDRVALICGGSFSPSPQGGASGTRVRRRAR
jgi:putative transcriptional regulator